MTTQASHEVMQLCRLPNSSMNYSPYHFYLDPVIDEDIVLFGRTHISLALILEWLQGGGSIDEIVSLLPRLGRAAIKNAILFEEHGDRFEGDPSFEKSFLREAPLDGRDAYFRSADKALYLFLTHYPGNTRLFLHSNYFALETETKVFTFINPLTLYKVVDKRELSENWASDFQDCVVVENLFRKTQRIVQRPRKCIQGGKINNEKFIHPDEQNLANGYVVLGNWYVFYQGGIYSQDNYGSCYLSDLSTTNLDLISDLFTMNTMSYRKNPF